MDNYKQAALASIDQISDLIFEMSDAIWDAAELGFHETKSAQLQLELLEKLGFEDIRTALSDIPTAFSARWGCGKPVIGFLGEYDALPELSQKANCTVRAPIAEGGNGHGCGHNLLGAGSIAAACAVKEYLQATGRSGTVIYYGCPAEENGAAKAFMARDGIFDELDLALTWHPDKRNAVWSDSNQANCAVIYKFKGVSSHAAVAPHMGRSALDAVELMNVGVQFLREHVLPSVRIHYAITDAGGNAPNVVQPKAEVRYLIRANNISDVQEVYERVNKIARGAALMTETEVDIQFLKSCFNLLPNWTLNRVLYENLKEVPLPEFTDEDRAFAEAIEASFPNPSPDPFAGAYPRLTLEEAEWMRQQETMPLMRCVLPLFHDHRSNPGSSDVGDVSWAVPTAQILAASWTANTPGHSWQATAMGKSHIAHGSLLYAGKVLAGAAIDLLNDPEAIEKAKAEHNTARGGKPFVSPLPKDVKPPIG